MGTGAADSWYPRKESAWLYGPRVAARGVGKLPGASLR